MDPISLHNIQQAVAPTVVGGRLELESSTEIQWKPYYNYSIGLYDGEQWKIVTPSGLVQTFNDFTTISGTSVAVDTNYDVYAKYESQNNFTLEFQEWAGATSRYEDPQRWQGIYVRDLTDEGKKMRWLGTIRMYNDSGAVFKDEESYRYIANYYNKKPKSLFVRNPTSSWDTQSNSTWREFNNGTGQIRGYFLSLEPEILLVNLYVFAFSNGSNSKFTASVALNKTNGYSTVSRLYLDADATGIDESVATSFVLTTETSIGLNYLTEVESGSSDGTWKFFENNEANTILYI